MINNLTSKTKELALTVATNYVIVYNTVTCWSDYRRGLDWRLDLLTINARLVTTLNYSAIANLHTLQMSTAHAKSFQSAVSSVVSW
jgi:hypothetical protein